MNAIVMTLCIVAAALAGAGAIVAFVLWIIRSMQNAPGGLGPLADRFPDHGELPSKVLKRQTIKVGMVTYKRSATLGIGIDALHLHVWGRKARIPWSEVKAIGSAPFQWSRWPTLKIGDPPVAEILIPQEALQALRAKLDHIA